MDLRHLATFIAIVEEGSFAQAAERLEYAQSTITLHMQQLEKALGIKVFDRHMRKVTLTPAGELLLRHARHVLSQVEHMQHDLADLASGESGSLRIGMIDSIARLYLVDVLRAFRARYPQIQLTVEVCSTLRIHEMLVEGQIELGISTPPPVNRDLIFEPLINEEMVLLLPHDHPLHAQKAILLRDLRRECLLLTHPPCAYRTAIEAAFMAHGLPLTVSIEIGSLEIIKQAVQQKIGIAILPQLATRHMPSDMVIRKIADWSQAMPIGIITRMIPSSQQRIVNTLSTMLKQAIVG